MIPEHFRHGFIGCDVRNDDVELLFADGDENLVHGFWTQLRNYSRAALSNEMLVNVLHVGEKGRIHYCWDCLRICEVHVISSLLPHLIRASPPD